MEPELQAREPHANWWHLERDREISYTFKTFLKTLLDQVRRKIHADKIEEKYEINDIEMILNERQFRGLAKMTKEKPLRNQKVQPILTFHGTRKPDHIASILRHGYLMPGLDIHPAKGYSVCMARGNYYGDGIYSSTDFDVSKWYSFLDLNGKITLIVNLVFIGKFEFVEPRGKNNIPVLFSSSKGYCSGSHTLISYDHRILISGVTRYVVPAMTVTLRPLSESHSYFQDIAIRVPGFLPLIKTPTYRFQSEIQDFEEGYVRCIRLCEDYHFMRFSSLHPEKCCDLVHHLIVPHTIRKQPRTLDCLSSFADSLESKKSWLYLEDDSNDRSDVTSCSAFRSKCDSYGYDSVDKTPEKFVPALEHCLDKITSEHSDHIHVVYVFVDKPIDRAQLGGFIARWKLYTKVHRIVLKLVLLNKEGKSDDLLKLKTELQTVHFFEEYVQTLDQKPLDEMLLQISEENRNIPIFDHQFSIPFPLGTVCDGFLIDMTQGPVWDTTAQRSVVFKGIPPPAIKIDGWFYRVENAEEPIHPIAVRSEHKKVGKPSTTGAPVGSAIVKRDCKRRGNSEKKGDSAASSNHDELHSTGKTKHEDLYPVTTQEHDKSYGVNCFISLLAKYRNYVLRFPSRCKNSIPRVKKLSRAIFNNIDRYEHPARSRTLLYQMKKFLSDVTTFGSVTFEDKWYQKLQNMKFAKAVIHRTHRTFDPSLVGELGKLEQVGFLMNVHRLSSSEVEPWTVVIVHISQELGSAGAMYSASTSGKKLRSSENHRVTDVLLTDAPKTDVERMYCSFVFTRTPYLYIESQYVALLTVSWVQTVRQIVAGEETYQVFNKLLLLTKEQLNTPENICHLASILNSHGNFSEYLTDLYDISSCCKMLGMLLLPHAAGIFTGQHYSRFSFQLLAESVMRNCRVMMRSTKNSPHKLLNRLLGITPSTNPKTYQFNLGRAKRLTNMFYNTKFTNCSPSTVIYVLGILEDFHKGFDPLERMRNGGITPKGFLQAHLPGEKGSVVQVALYIQGIKFSKARLRKSLYFENPQQIIDEAISERLYVLQRKKEASKSVMQKQEAKLSKRIEEALPFKNYHKMPKIFGYGEVATLNKERDNNDQLELLYSGLLKHHCCYPECPYFLENFSTANDRKNGTRHGIMSHLRHNWLNYNYVPNFHENAIKIIHRSRSFNEFTTKMKEIYRRSRSVLKEQFLSCEDLDSKLRTVYAQVCDIPR